MKIIGAGLSGLIAAHAFPKFPILEASSGPWQAHQALLRFRGDAVSTLTNIPFRKVVVNKGIWSRGEFKTPSIALANAYSMKVLGRLADRSIWNLEVAERFVAPEDFYDQLVENCRPRISWGARHDFGQFSGPIISTAPLPMTLAALGRAEGIKFEYAPITVKRLKLPGADVFQTVYFPDSTTCLYRASITKDVLICEFMRPSFDEDSWMNEVSRAFGINELDEAPANIKGIRQKYGKISPLPDDLRRRVIGKLTVSDGIYSIGRFATWRNSLLDDVVKDAQVIKNLIACDDYAARLVRAKQGI